MIYQPNLLGWALNITVMGVGIWALVELGMLKGTTGANEYGPDPIPGATSTVAAV